MTHDGGETIELDRAECLRRLGGSGTGRVAVTVGALPAIFPINYAVLDGDVVFRTIRGTSLTAALCDAVIAFEVDDVSPIGASRAVWSVVVVGPSRELTDPVDVARAGGLPLPMWARAGDADCVVRLRSDLVSGRETSRSLPLQAAVPLYPGGCEPL